MRKGLGLNQFYNKKFKRLKFTGKWFDSVGEPATAGTWFIYGPSYNGKTSFAVQLTKYLMEFGNVGYLSLEEGESASLQEVFMLHEVPEDGKNKVRIYSDEHFTEFEQILENQKAPKFWIIDSFQYTQWSAMAYKELTKKNKDKLFILISHADGRKPKGDAAQSVHYHADVKIYIEGFKAFVKSRFKSDTQDFIIYDKKAEEIWLNS